MKQGRVICTTTMTNAPEFLIDAWTLATSENDKRSLATFLQEYTRVLHVGCYKRFGKIHNNLLGKFLKNKLKFRNFQRV